MWLIITILIGIIGALIGIKLKIPAGAIIGALISVVIFNVLTGKAVFPQEFKIITQMGTGAYIGSQISKKDVLELKKIVKPAIILTTSLCAFNIVVGVFLSKNTNIDLVTALFATAPAGLTDMTLISVDFGADSSKVAALQLVRLITVVTFMPTLIKYFILKTNFGKNHSQPKNVNDKTSHSKDSDKEIHKPIGENFKREIYTLGIGAISGTIGFFAGVPAGVISFSMIGCAFYNIQTSEAYMSINLRRGIQVLGGCLIGAKITMQQVISMKELLPSVVIILIGYITLSFLLAFLMTKYSTLDMITALYSSTPGGLTDMTIISSEMGADAPKVASMHFARVFSVVAFYPIIIKALLKIL